MSEKFNEAVKETADSLQEMTDDNAEIIFVVYRNGASFEKPLMTFTHEITVKQSLRVIQAAMSCIAQSTGLEEKGASNMLKNINKGKELFEYIQAAWSNKS